MPLGLMCAPQSNFQSTFLGPRTRMESLKPVLLVYGAKGLSLLRKSKYVLKVLIEKHRGKLLAAVAVGMGATAYLQTKMSKPAPVDAPKSVRRYFLLISMSVEAVKTTSSQI